MAGVDFLAGTQIVVIGGGVVGSSITYRLAQAGAKVTLVEGRYPGGGTTGNSFAWLNSFNKLPRTYHDLNMRSIRDHRDLEEELNGKWLTIKGGLHWANRGDFEEVDSLDEEIKRLQSWGARVERYSPLEVTRILEPDVCLDPAVIDDVYMLPSEGWVQTAPMVHALIEAAVHRYGAELIIDSVSGFAGGADSVDTAVLKSGARISADLIVLAAGHDVGRLAKIAGSEVRLEEVAGTLAVSAPAPTSITRVLRGPRGLSIRQDRGGRILMASDSTLGVALDFVPSLDSPEMALLAESVRKLLPSLRNVPLEAIRRGVRAIPSDGRPIIGSDSTVKGLYYAVMHSGVTLSARVGNLVVEDILDTDPPELAALRPDRFESMSYTGTVAAGE